MGSSRSFIPMPCGPPHALWTTAHGKVLIGFGAIA